MAGCVTLKAVTEGQYREIALSQFVDSSTCASMLPHQASLVAFSLGPGSNSSLQVRQLSFLTSEISPTNQSANSPSPTNCTPPLPSAKGCTAA